MNPITAEQALSTAIYGLSTSTGPFFGCAAMSLEKVFSSAIPTAATDGRTLRVNPDWFLTLDRGEREFVVAHEAAHFVLLHCDPSRSTGMPDKGRANRAMDFAINLILHGAGMRLPQNVLLDRKYVNLTCEQIYAQLKDEDEAKQEQKRQEQEQDESGDDEQNDEQEQGDDQPGDEGDEGDEEQSGDQGGDDDSGEGDQQDEEGAAQGQGGAEDAQQGSGQGGDKFAQFSGDVLPTPDGEEAEAAKSDALAAIQRAQAAGTLPGGVAREVGTAIDKPRPLCDLLREFVESACSSSSDFSYRRPSMMSGGGFLLPGQLGEQLPPVAVLVDTSGSVDEEMIRLGADTLTQVCEDMSVSELRAFYVDTQTHGEPHSILAGEQIDLKPVGGGGTDFCSFFADDEAYADCCCVVALTDLWATFPPRAPAIPVIWVGVGRSNGDAPWGRVATARK